MKRDINEIYKDINEIYKLIEAKIENCMNDFHRFTDEIQRMEAQRFSKKRKFSLEKITDKLEERMKIVAMMDAYTDVKILLETSGVLKEPINQEANDKFAKYRDKMFKFFNCNDHVVLPSGEVVIFIKKRNEEEYYRSKGEKYDDSKHDEEKKERS